MPSELIEPIKEHLGRPYVVGWKAYGGHTMYFKHLRLFHGSEQANATCSHMDARGFSTRREAEKWMVKYKVKYKGIRVIKWEGQIDLF